MSEAELKEIESVISGEDEPNVCWFVDTIERLIAKIRLISGAKIE